jgi:cytochrome c oxidase assembly protein subunit 15
MTMTRDNKIATWLFICAFSVFLMALVGAVTRLTESGLSIVDWRPVTGAVPPLSAGDWQIEFDKYRTSPQYQKVNRGMTLDEFKDIYFWEWVHRFWGRVIGLIYALPLIWFWIKGWLPPDRRKYFLGILALGGLQGLMGWLMVKSGLVDAPAVSHYRLAAHLLLAFLIFGCLVRLALTFARPQFEKDADRLIRLRPLLRSAIWTAGVVMLWGAFVAGLDAGMVYNSFPTMDGHWFPPETAQHQPVWRAFFEEPATVQWTHRVLAMLFLVKVIFLLRRGVSLSPPPGLKRGLVAVAAMAVLQVLLGIAALLTQVNIVLATAHQAGALVMIFLLVYVLHSIPRKVTT